MNSRILMHCALIIAPLLAAPGQTATRYVSTGGTDGGGCVSTAAPCATVFYALLQADDGDTISIGSGTFTEPFGLDISRPITLEGKSRGGHQATIIQPHSDPGQATTRVIEVHDSAEEVYISDLVIRHGLTDGSGGGLLYRGTQTKLHLENVAFDANQAGSGGGIHIAGGTHTLKAVEFRNNVSVYAGGGMLIASNNGSASLYDTTGVLTDVSFIGNRTDGRGGGLNVTTESDGTQQPRTVSLMDVRFIGNAAQLGGGGMYNASRASVLTNTRFIGNGTDAEGGGMFIHTGAPTLTNVIFFNNLALGNGGGLRVFNGTMNNPTAPVLTNVTLAGNLSTGAYGGGIYAGDRATAALTNTIVWGNAAAEGGNNLWVEKDDDASIVLRHSLYGDGPDDIGGDDFDIENSLTVSPRFANPSSDDLHLNGDSPAIDAGDPDTDLSLFPGGPVIPFDIDGDLRMQGAAIDIGAYEQPRVFDDIFNDAFKAK